MRRGIRGPIPRRSRSWSIFDCRAPIMRPRSSNSGGCGAEAAIDPSVADSSMGQCSGMSPEQRGLSVVRPTHSNPCALGAQKHAVRLSTSRQSQHRGARFGERRSILCRRPGHRSVGHRTRARRPLGAAAAGYSAASRWRRRLRVRRFRQQARQVARAAVRSEHRSNRSPQSPNMASRRRTCGLA
jgi:hypothetical protein